MVPDLPTFAFDQGFAYRVPPALIEQVAVGSMVRVPLAGRRVRGYVIGLEEVGRDPGPANLKDVRSVSSAIPVYTKAMLPSLRWAAGHYVAPLAGILARTGPPNLPKRPLPVDLPSVPSAHGPVPEVAEAAAVGGPGRTVQLLAGTGWAQLIRGMINAPMRAERSVLIVAPSAMEAADLADRLQADFGCRVVRVADQDDATVTAAWSQAATRGGLVVVGTLRVGWWPVRDLSMIVLVEDGRRGMKERQTPTVAARALARVRSAAEDLQLVLVGRIPTVHTLHEGVSITRVPGRLWAPVEIVDRADDPPGGGLLSSRVRVAVASTLRRGGRVFVFTHRRGYAPAARCTGCRRLRRCPDCGARPDHRATCPRCEAALGACGSCGGTRFEPLGAAVGRVTEELRRVVGEAVGEVASGSPVTVGTERDLIATPPVDLAVVVDADGLVMGTNYRAAEDALAILARTAATVRQGRGRMMLQTAESLHPVYTALRRGDPLPFLEDELAARRRLSLPPTGEVLVMEVEGADDPSALDLVLGGAVSDEALLGWIRACLPDIDLVFTGANVYGPALEAGRIRWMIQGDDLRNVKDRLRPAVGSLRDQGFSVRVDVDPREF